MSHLDYASWTRVDEYGVERPVFNAHVNWSISYGNDTNHVHFCCGNCGMRCVIEGFIKVSGRYYCPNCGK